MAPTVPAVMLTWPTLNPLWIGLAFLFTSGTIRPIALTSVNTALPSGDRMTGGNSLPARILLFGTFFST